MPSLDEDERESNADANIAGMSIEISILDAREAGLYFVTC